VKRLIMEYLLFTLPNCPKCDAMKAYLKETSLEVQEFDLVKKNGRVKIKDYLKVLNRDEKGSIIIPTMIIRDAAEVVSVLNTREELDSWLRSRA